MNRALDENFESHLTARSASSSASRGATRDTLTQAQDVLTQAVTQRVPSADGGNAQTGVRCGQGPVQPPAEQRLIGSLWRTCDLGAGFGCDSEHRVLARRGIRSGPGSVGVMPGEGRRDERHVRSVPVAACRLQEHYRATGAGIYEPARQTTSPDQQGLRRPERGRAEGPGLSGRWDPVRWGLVPAWWKPGIDPKTSKQKTMPSLHNARADRVATAPSWRGPFARRRAVIPAAGYYEWLPTEDVGGKPFKQPYYIPPAGGLLSFAGLYELWRDRAVPHDHPDACVGHGTHHATWLAGVMDDRTPVILPADRIGAWLDRNSRTRALHRNSSAGSSTSRCRPAVSTAVTKTGRGGSQARKSSPLVGDQPLRWSRLNQPRSAPGAFDGRDPGAAGRRQARVTENECRSRRPTDIG
jgi:putative SOS response-associated peptidase YedK